MKKTNKHHQQFFKVLFILFTCICCNTITVQAQNVNIPDANFKAYLVGNTEINTNADTEIQVSEASAFAGAIVCSGMNINSLDGIEAFTKLIILDCGDNSFSNLDLSKNLALKVLECYGNNITTLDVSKNLVLSLLSCENNQITSLDVSNNLTLTTLLCQDNALTTLDVSKNLVLNLLGCGYNQITTLDVSNNLTLKILFCPDNALSTLDVSKNLALNLLECYGNNITTLDVSKNLDLSFLSCGYNQITTLDVSNNLALNYLFCQKNQFTSLDLSKNTNLINLHCLQNPSLFKICVSDVEAANNNAGFQKESYQTWVSDCVDIAENNKGEQVACLNGTFLPISVSVSETGAEYQWFSSVTSTSGSGINLGVAAQTSSYVPTSNQVGTIYYYCVVSVGDDILTSDVFGPIRVNEPASLHTVTSPINYCVGNVAQALVATGSSLKWYATPNGGVGNATAPIPITTIAGNFNYYVSQTTNGCESNRSLITVNVHAIPTSPVVVSPLNYCVANVTQALTASGNSLKWYTAPNGGVVNTIAPVPLTTVAGNFNYYVSQTTNGCESNRSLITVNVNGLPSVPVVTGGINYCVGDVSQALNATGASLKWYAVPTGGIGNAMAPTPPTNASGNFNYYVSQTIGMCESERSVMVVQVHPSPIPIVSSIVNYCIGEIAQPLPATGSNLKWFTSPNVGTASIVAPVPTTAVSGMFLHYVSQKTGSCESERVAIIVNVNPKSDAPSVLSAVDYCVGSPSVPLAACGTNLKWYTTQNGTTYSSVAITPATSTIGTTNYYVSQTSNGCESARSRIAVNVQQAPSAPTAVSPINYCLGSITTPLSATGSNLYWYASNESCSGSGMSPFPSASIAGSTSYFVSQKINGCESAKKEIVVVVNNSGAAPIVTSPVSVFIGVTASALTASGTNLKWYSSATDNVGTAVAPIPSTAVAGMTDYFVSQTINGCESARALIKVLVNGDISAPTCFNLGGTYPFELSPVNTVNATNYNWWANGSVQNISQNSNSPRAIISTGQYFTTGQVCVGINYNQAPWYKQICIPIDLCANASSSAGSSAPISLVNVSPNPTFDQFSIHALNNVQQVTIKNMLGQNVYTIGDMLANQTINFGTELTSGVYVLQFKTSDGSNHTVSIIKQ